MEVRFIDLRQVSEGQMQRWMQWLTSEEQEHMVQCRVPRPHICAHGLAREMLAQKLGLAPEQVRFFYGEYGKPLVSGAYFNLSHSGDIVLCAVSDVPVGVDVERLRAVKPHLCQQFGTDDPETFFRQWTETEARIKCCGAAAGHWKRFKKPIEGYSVAELAVPEGYVAAVCEKRG